MSSKKLIDPSQSNVSTKISSVSTSEVQRQGVETVITQLLQEDEIQDRIRLLLQSAMKEELAKLSVILREAVRNWIFKEKEKYKLDEKPLLATQPEAKKDKEISTLQDEIKTLKRQLDLKNHENHLITSALKKMMNSEDNST